MIYASTGAVLLGAAALIVAAVYGTRLRWLVLIWLLWAAAIVALMIVAEENF